MNDFEWTIVQGSSNRNGVSGVEAGRRPGGLLEAVETCASFTSRRESVLKFSDQTPSTNSTSVPMSIPVPASHSRTVLASDPEAIVRLSGGNERKRTGSVWPVRGSPMIA